MAWVRLLSAGKTGWVGGTNTHNVPYCAPFLVHVRLNATLACRLPVHKANCERSTAEVTCVTICCQVGTASELGGAQLQHVS